MGSDHGLSFGELRDFIIAGAPLPFTSRWRSGAQLGGPDDHGQSVISFGFSAEPSFAAQTWSRVA
jgi:hypothetical protein